MRNQINSLINNGTPLVNSFISTTTSNTQPRINAQNITNNVNQIMDTLTPFITLFSDFGLNNSRN